MSTSSAVPQIQWTSAGVVIPSAADVLSGTQSDINSAFGGDLNPALTTPQGQLASSLAAIVSSRDADFLELSNQVDPQYASGRWQDAIGRIYLMTRDGAEATVVSCTLTGPGGVVPAGTLAQDTSGNTYVLTTAVTIPSTGGTVTSSWQNTVTGPIACPAGTLTKVYKAVPGWDAITNPTAGVLGRNVESATEFEIRRQNSVAANARGSVQAIQAAVYAVDNVLDCYVIDNPSSSTVNTGSSNYPMLPHSLYVGVVGGVAADVAKAIWLKKDTGCDYNGNTGVTVQDTSSTYGSGPYPSYRVLFNIPTNTPVLFAVQIVNSTTLPANIVSLIQAAIVAQFTGATGLVPQRMGAAVTASSYYGAVLGAAPNITALSILVGITSPTLPQVVMGIDQEPIISASNITVTLV